MSIVPAMKLGALSVLAIALSVSPAAFAKRHHPHVRHARAGTLNLTRVNLHPVRDLYRPMSAPSFGPDKLPTEKSFRMGPAGLTGSVGYHTSPAANAIPKSDLNQAAATQYGSGDKTVGAAVGIRF